LNANASNPRGVFAVTVTYGNRFALLERVIAATLANGVERMIVVDNGSVRESREKIETLAADSGGRVALVSLPANLGSAAGFKAGLEHVARRSECQFVWLLDDDNQPGEKALDTLFDQHGRLSQSIAQDQLSLASLRQSWDQHRKLAHGVAVHRVFPRHSSFMGFHLLIPPRVLAGVFHYDRPVRPSNEPAIQIPLAPYGGLFFDKRVISKLGYPNESFFLYNDDTEYTYRFTSRGGKLFLVPGSVLFDLDNSWHLVNEGETFVSHFLLADSDWRIYYATRNQSYVSRHFWARNFLVYSINKWAFFVLLSLYALRHRRWKRLVLIARAARQGELGELGRRPDLEALEQAQKHAGSPGRETRDQHFFASPET